MASAAASATLSAILRRWPCGIASVSTSMPSSVALCLLVLT
jgi:hypothetical protein